MNARSVERLLLWDSNSASFQEPESMPSVGYGPPSIVDSWLVTDGRVRAFPAHVDRFRAACASMYGVPADEVVPFMASAIAEVPVRGRWFPRAELAFSGRQPRLQFRVRPAPPQGLPVTLWVSDSPDRRRHPDVKGPDLAYLAGLREQAVERGADEALILAPDGSVSEGASTSVLWWRGDTLCGPPSTPHLLGGVTSRLLLDAVRAAGIRTRTEQARPDELYELEVWVVNALHGIRPVNGWLDVDVQPAPAGRAATWIAELNSMADTVPTIGRRSRRPILAAAPSRRLSSVRPCDVPPIRRAVRPAVGRPALN